MSTDYRQHRLRALACLLALGQIAAGCSVLPLNHPEPAEPVASEPQLPPDPGPETLPEAERDPAPEPEPVSPPVPEPAPPAPPPRVAIVVSSRVPAYGNVADALMPLLADAWLYDLTDKSLTPKEMFDDILDTGTAAVVAIGLRAAEFATAFEDIPVVYSQVFNTGDLSGPGDNMWGVSAIPPLDRQLDAWREVNPELRNVGAILGPGHEALLAEAEAATAARGMRLHYRVASSDRETFYLFSRLVPDIDGFWLFPDNRVLSSEVLREMLAYAGRHEVDVAVFNEALLSLGATISAESDHSDVAGSIAAVLDGLLEGQHGTLPELTPLTRVVVTTGQPVTQRIAEGAAPSPRGAH